ncbi:EAL domain-containing protein [Pseudomonas borbori]
MSTAAGYSSTAPIKPRSPAWLPTAVLMLLMFSAAAMGQHTEVRVGVYDNAPKIMLDADGKLSGIFGDLLGEIARQENWRLIIVPCAWQDCLERTARGEIDLLPDVAPNPARDRVLDFHKVPSLVSWSQLYRRNDVALNSVLDLEGMRIVVLAGSIQQDYMKSLLESFSLKAQLIPMQRLEEGFEWVASNQADAVVTNQRFGDFHAPRFQLRATPIMFQPTQLFYATREGQNAALLSTIDRYLLKWQDAPSSFYYRTLHNWGGERPRVFIPQAAWWGLAILLCLLLASIGGALLLRRQVARQTRHLLASEQRLNTILDSVEAYIYIKDPQLNYQYANRKVCELFGRPLEKVVGCSDKDFFDDATAANLNDNDLRVLRLGERVETEEINRAQEDGQEHTFLSVKLPLRHADGRIYALCGISTDISEHKRNLEQIHQLAFYDPLTGLPNRRLLIDRLQHALAQRTRSRKEGALLFIDLDNFKDLNDTLGHDMGDRLLQQVAQRLRQHVREQDTLARLGGDEFVLMLEDLSLNHDTAIQQLESVTRKILQALAVPYALGERSYSSTASIGVALFSDDHNTVDELLKRADLAMYEAKSSGRNTLRFFNPEMQAQVSARADLENDLRQSLSERHFTLHYQPQVDEQGRLFGAEALVRWQHPRRGLVPPAQFIPLAESNGLILPLGRWILYTACQQLVAWAHVAEMRELHLAINVSARQFHHPDFVGDVLAALDETGANPQRLKLELTESQLIEDVEAMIAKMTQLKARGVCFSLDDFGTGYSSLSYLKRLPLDYLKIDQSFVRDLLIAPSDAAIVRTIVALGSNLNLQVIAEGVETREQHEALLSLGCRKFQGYLYGRPARVEHLEQWPSRKV